MIRLCAISGVVFTVLGAGAEGREPMGFYYGGGLTAEAAREFDRVVIEARNYAPADLVALAESSGTRLIGYLSLGETTTLDRGDGSGPGGYASWYVDLDADGQPDRNPMWNSWYVDASDPNWQAHVLDQAIPALGPGIAGLFLDTIDTVDVIGSSARGMMALVRAIRRHYPALYLVQNRGFTVLSKTAPYIDALLVEALTTGYDPATGTDRLLQDWEIAELDDLMTRVHRLRRDHPFEIWSLDYRQDMHDQVTLRAILEHAARLGVVPATSDRGLQRLDELHLNRVEDPVEPGVPPELDLASVEVSAGAEFLAWDLHFQGTLDPLVTQTQILLDSGSDLVKYGYGGQVNADILVENGQVYRYAGDGTSWQWSWLGAASGQFLGAHSRIELPSAYLQVPGNRLISSTALVFDASWAMWDESEVVNFVTPTTSYAVVDPAESVPTSEDITGLTVNRANEQWQVTVQLAGPVNNSNEHFLLIEADGRASGFDYREITASHMVNADGVHRYVGDGGDWRWEYLAPAPSEAGNDALRYLIPQLGQPGYAWEIMAVIRDPLSRTIDKTSALQIINR